MQFPADPVDLKDCQMNWEFLKKAAVTSPGNGLRINAGQLTITFTASTNGIGPGAQAHGLGRTPIAIVVTSFGAPAFGNIPLCDVYTFNASTFGCNGESKVAFTGNVVCSWVAIG